MGVETPVEWVIIFRLAGWTHGEDTHGGFVAIIGDILHNGEAGATVGAVDEGVAVAAVVWIEKFVETIGTGSGIG